MFSLKIFITLIPLLPLLGFAINATLALVWARRGKPGPEWLSAFTGCLLPGLSFFIAAWLFWHLQKNPFISSFSTGPLFTWMQTGLFQADFGFVLDHLSVVMTLVITGVGSLIHLYSVGYMHGDKGFARYFSYLNLFLFFMLLLVLGDNLLVLFVGWEGVGLCSYLLIGFWFTDRQKAFCGKKAFVVNRIGDFGFLVGLFLILLVFSNQLGGGDRHFLNYAFLQEHRHLLLPVVSAVTLCFFAGATGKSAQIPLYVWLPDAMAGPTPVSALIHAATMVTAGVYMVARLFFLFELAPQVLHLVAWVGVVTAFMAALIAMTQTDIKKVLAYSTVSQLGFMFLGLGVGVPQAAIFHVVTHAFFKACLFLCAGSVLHALHHEQDILNMGGLAKKMPITCGAFLVSTLAISGIPPFAGFFSKDEILWHAFLSHQPALYGIAMLTAGLTAFYMARLFVYVFLGTRRDTHHEVGKVSWMMNTPVFILGILAVIGGFMGIPAILGGHASFQKWLSFLHEMEHGALSAEPSLEFGLMMASAIWAALFGLSSFILYSTHLNWSAGLKQKLGGLYQLAKNKFSVDEIYDALLVRPFYGFSKYFLWKGADQKLIDGLLVLGFADVATFSAQILSRAQTGLLNHYLFYLWVGLGVFLWLVV